MTVVVSDMVGCMGSMDMAEFVEATEAAARAEPAAGSVVCVHSSSPAGANEGLSTDRVCTGIAVLLSPLLNSLFLR